jgi:hypothetical protein
MEFLLFLCALTSFHMVGIKGKQVSKVRLCLGLDV